MSDQTPDDFIQVSEYDLGLLVMSTLAFTMGIRGSEPDTAEGEQKYIELRQAAQRVGHEIGLELVDWTPSDWQAR